MKRLLILLALLLAIGGCDREATGSVYVGFGTGYVYYQSSGWYAETTSASLTVTATVETDGEARVTGGEWKIITAPAAGLPLISNPTQPTTLITFPAPGIYEFEYHIYWHVDGNERHSVAPLQFVVYPSGPG